MLWKQKTSRFVAQTESERICLNQIRSLTQALIASGAVNILLLAFILYGLFGDGVLIVRESLEPRAWRIKQAFPISGEKTIKQSLQSLQKLSMEQLVAKLEDVTLIEDGYRERDLALGYLVWRHSFNLSKALTDQPISSIRRLPISCGGKVSYLILYPGLSSKQFESILHFAKTERWPQTSEGLFYRLKSGEHKADPMLAEAFCLTPEFLTLQRLLNRADVSLDKAELLSLSLKGDWKFLEAAIAKLQAAPENFRAAAQACLVDYLQKGSDIAAKLIAKQGGRRLDDQTALLVLRLLKSQPAECKAFASELLKSPRSDLVWQEARQFGEERAVAPPIATKVKAVVKEMASKVYVVQEGDSLWKISRLFQVDLNKLKAYNALSSDLLRPGFSLRIP